MLRLKNISKKYFKMSNKAVDDVSLNIKKNEMIGIVGESGCGKSTVAKIMVNLEKPSKGTVLYDSMDVSKIRSQNLKEYRKNCQMIFQDTLETLNPLKTVYDSLCEPLENHFDLDKSERKTKIERIVKHFSINTGILDRYPVGLSGGERQRINICRALLLEPKVLICDEILSSLDVATQMDILQTIRNLNKKHEMSVVFISHDIHVVKYLCNKIIVMEKGRFVETLKRVNQEWEEAKHPYTKKLISSVLISHPADRRL